MGDLLLPVEVDFYGFTWQTAGDLLQITAGKYDIARRLDLSSNLTKDADFVIGSLQFQGSIFSF